jgi:hypothetical protein
MNKKTLILIGIVVGIVIVCGFLVFKFGYRMKQEKQPNVQTERQVVKSTVKVIVNETSAFPITSQLKQGETLNLSNVSNKKLSLKVRGPFTFVMPINPGANIQAPIFGSKTGTYKLEFDTVPPSVVTVKTVE